MNNEKNKKKWVGQVVDVLTIGNRSDKTIHNYVSSIKRFLDYYNSDVLVSKFNEENIIEYLKVNFIEKNYAADTYNMNICAIRFLFSVCFKKELNRKLLPSVKLKKSIPTIISKQTFIKIFNAETHLNHKCWFLLGFCCGLRVEEVVSIKIENIYSKEHKLKVLGKGNKERFTILPDIVIKYLRLYCKSKNIKDKSGYLFKGTSNKEHTNPKTVINYFHALKFQYNLNKNITFHSLRHSFATYYLMNGGNILTLKSMLGHKTLNTTCIYIHLSQNFNNLEGIKYV